MNEEMKAFIKQYLKENLQIHINVDKDYGSYSESDRIEVDVRILLENEVISSSSGSSTIN